MGGGPSVINKPITIDRLFQCVAKGKLDLFKESYEIEKNVIEKLSEYKYIPQVKFPGYKECLDINYKDEVLSEIKKNIIEKYNKNLMVGEILDYEYNN
jgi:hypothetical protein